MVLGGGEGDDGFAVCQDEETCFFACQEFFYDDVAVFFAEGSFGDAVDGVEGFGLGFGDGDAFSGGDSVGFDDDGGFLGLGVLAGGVWVLESGVGGGGDFEFRAEVSCEAFRGFQFGGFGGGAEGWDVGVSEFIGESVDEGLFGSDDGEVDIVFLAEFDDVVVVWEFDGLADLADGVIFWGCDEFSEMGAS